MRTGLHQLDSTLNDLQTYGLVVDHFNKNSAFPKLTIKQKFINQLFSSLIKKLSKEIFLGHKSQVSLKNATKELNGLQEQEKKLQKQIDVVDQKIQSKIDDKMGQQKWNDLSSYQQYKFREKYTPESYGAWKNERGEIRAKITKLNEKIDKLEQTLELGREMRKNFHVLGGANVKIDIPKDKSQLDGTYISCEAFKSTLKTAGAQSYKMKFNPVAKGDQTSIPFELNGLVFPSNVEGSVIDKALTSLGAFSSTDKTGAGWQKLYLPDHSIVLITDEEAEKLNDLNLMQDNRLRNSSRWNVQTDKNELTSENTTGGTVILTSGNAGVYEMHKREVLAYLMRGMNVFAFNFRGYGESTGKPSGEGLKHDMEAAYQYVKQTFKVPDEKILVKALCMSGGPAADLAAHHPNVNFFVDQSYANFDEIVKMQVDEAIQEYTDQHDRSALASWAAQNMTSIIHATVKLATPAWSIEKEIGKIKGHVGILSTSNDALIKLDRDVDKNYQAALDGVAQTVTKMSMEGTHGDSWVQDLAMDDSYKIALKDEAAHIARQVGRSNPEVGKQLDVRIPAIATGKLNPLEIFCLNELAKIAKDYHQQIKINHAKPGEDLFNAVMEHRLKEVAFRDYDPDKLRAKIMRESENLFVKSDILAEVYYLIIEKIQNNPDISPRELLKFKEKVIRGIKPAKSQGAVREFLDQILQLKIHDKRFEGREVMDEFLKKSGLMGSLL